MNFEIVFPGMASGCGAARSTLRRAALWLLLAIAALLAGCASPIIAKVTSYNVWPEDAAGGGYAWLRPEASTSSELEQATWEGYVRRQLEALGLKAVTAGEKPRFLVEVTATGTTKQKTVLEPVYDNQLLYVPPTRDNYGNVYLGYWAGSSFGTRYLGDREVLRTVQVSRLKVRLLEAKTSGTANPRAVFESTAVYEGNIEDLPDLVPFLARAVFDGFPGRNGSVRLLKLDTKTGELKPAA